MKKFGKLLLIGLLVFGLALTAMGCGSSEEAGKTEEEKVYVVGTDAAYAPFEYQEDGKITGFDIELLQAIADAEGIKVEFKNMDFGGLIAALQTGSIDVLISAMTITEDRAKEVDFSETYFTVEGQAVVVKAGEKVENLEALVGKKVGVQMSTTGHLIAEGIEGINKDDIKPFPTMPEAMMSLQNGSVYAAIGDAPVVQKWLDNNPNNGLEVLENIKFDPENYGMAVKKGNAELLGKLNSGLQKVKDSGKYDELYNKYFPAQ